MQFKINDIVRVKPPVGCCNSTLVFQEWNVLKLFNVKVKEKPDIKMAVVESDGHVEVFRQGMLELITIKQLTPVKFVDTFEVA